MSKLEDRLPDLYNELHAQGAFRGKSWERHKHDLVTFFNRCGVPYGEGERVIDFGCGPWGGLAADTIRSYEVFPYDAFVPAYRDTDPWQKSPTTFFSSDVFEHLNDAGLRELTRRLCKHTGITKLFIVLTARAANKTFSNGVNVHLTIQPPSWWHGFLVGVLGGHFDLKHTAVDLLDQECQFGFVRHGQPYEQ